MRKNIQAQDYSFDEKKKVYTNRDNMSTSFELTRKIFEKEQWRKEEIEERQQELIKTLNGIIDIF